MHSTTMWVHRPQQRTSLVTRQQRIVTSMETQRALLPRQQTYLEIQRPHIVTATGTPSAPRLRQQTIWVPKTRSNGVTPVTHPSGRGNSFG